MLNSLALSIYESRDGDDLEHYMSPPLLKYDISVSVRHSVMALIGHLIFTSNLVKQFIYKQLQNSKPSKSNIQTSGTDDAAYLENHIVWRLTITKKLLNREM